MNGSNPLEGRVEICINNAWGTVCDNHFGQDDADVICNQLDEQMGIMHNGKQHNYYIIIKCVGRKIQLFHVRMRQVKHTSFLAKEIAVISPEFCSPCWVSQESLCPVLLSQ